MFRTGVIKVTGKETHHFLALWARSMRPVVKDKQGRDIVFLNRNQCEKEVRKVVGKKANLAIIGMGDENWAAFQREMSHVMFGEHDGMVQFNG